MLFWLSLFALALLCIEYAGGSCMHLNYCSGNGKCNMNSCSCYEGFGADSDISNYKAPDCSARTCPAGVSWGDLMDRKGKSHRTAECSDRGNCDRKTGRCVCVPGFTGSACQRNSCNNQCSGHGVCLTMNKYSMATDAFPLSMNVTQYNSVNDTDAWDRTSIQGCVCDSSWAVGLGANETQLSEFFGGDCSQRHCPSGDNPRTAVDETDCQGKSQAGAVNDTLLLGKAFNRCHIDCSNQGICNFKTGVCKCFPGFYGANCGHSDLLPANAYSPEGIYFNEIASDGQPIPYSSQGVNTEDVVDLFPDGF